MKKGQIKPATYWYQKGRNDALSELKIGDLRQWLNEKPKDHLVTDEDIKIMLEIRESIID